MQKLRYLYIPFSKKRSERKKERRSTTCVCILVIHMLLIVYKCTHAMLLIRLHVTFGKPDNFCKEPLTFAVVDFPGTYHALLGWRV
jgi:hypothetical protein